MSSSPVFPGPHARPRWYWWVLIVWVGLALGLGTVGYRLLEHGPVRLAVWLDALYHSMQLFVLHFPHSECPVNWWLELGRWLAALLFWMTAVIALGHVLAAELQQFRLGLTSGHTVICGLGPRALQLVRGLRRGPNRVPVVVAALQASAEEIATCRAVGAMVVVGDPAAPATLLRARLGHARQLIALNEEDSVNAEIAAQARSLLCEKKAIVEKTCLRCYVQLTDVGLRSSLQNAAVFSTEDARCQVRFFDVFDATARRLLLGPGRLPLDHGGISATDSRQVHLVILGFGRMGRQLAVRTAQLGHFANRRPLRISVIDRAAERHEQALLFRYPAFPQTCDTRFHEMEIESRHARQLLDCWCADQQSVTSIAVCFDQDPLALEVALRLLPQLKEFGIPMAIRVSREAGFASLLREPTARPDLSSYMRTFGTAQDHCWADVFEDPLNERLAQAVHADFREKRLAEDRDPADPSVRPWESLSEGFKDSNRQQADHIAIKLQGIGCERVAASDLRPAIEEFELDEVEVLAEMEHNRWNAERWLAGWTLGPVDKPRKITPYLVPWSSLPPEIQDYDRQAVRLIPGLLARIGEKVCRR